MSDIVVLGSINMDLVVRSPQMPRPGETLRGSGFTTVPGGKGANQAAAAAHLGASVQMIGCVGQDAFGQTLLTNLTNQGVDVSSVRTTNDEASGIALIIVDDDGENSIVVAPGANYALQAADVARNRQIFKQARMLVMQLEIPLGVAAEAIYTAKEIGLPVVLNAAPATKVPAELLRGICVIVNESEAETITGIPVHSDQDAYRVCLHLMDLGAETAIVTLGPNGAVYSNKNTSGYVQGVKVKAIDTTGAGDTFVGAFSVALLEGRSLGEAVAYANCAGALATTVLGAQTSIPQRNDVDALYEKTKSLA